MRCRTPASATRCAGKAACLSTRGKTDTHQRCVFSRLAGVDRLPGAMPISRANASACAPLMIVCVVWSSTARAVLIACRVLCRLLTAPAAMDTCAGLCSISSTTWHAVCS